MELTVVFQGADDVEELIYSGGTRENHSWLPSKAGSLFCGDKGEGEFSIWKTRGLWCGDEVEDEGELSTWETSDLWCGDEDEDEDEGELSTWKNDQSIPQKCFGTPIPFRVTKGVDFTERFGESQRLVTRSQSITDMSIYSDKSFDELRFEDYWCMERIQDTNEVFSNHIDNSFVHLNQPNAATCISSSWPLPSSTLTQTDGTSRGNTPQRSPRLAKVKLRTKLFKKLLATNAHEVEDERTQHEINVLQDVKQKIDNFELAVSSEVELISTNSRRNSGAKPTSDLFIPSNCKFPSKGDRDFVFNPLQPCSEDSCDRKEPLSTVKSRLQLRDTLVQNIVKCRKIQNSLYKLVLLKLQSHVTAVIRDHSDSTCSETSASTKERSIADENNPAGDPSVEDMTGTVHGASEVPTTESEVEGLNDSLVCPSEKNEMENAGYAASVVVGAELNIDKAPEVPTMESKINASGESDVSKAPSAKSSSVQEIEEDSEHNIPKSNLYTSTQAASSVSSSGDVASDKSQVSRLCRRAFLCGLKEPLDAFVRCTDIQRSLFHNLAIVNTSSEEAFVISERKRLSCLNNSTELNCEELADFLLVQSKFEEITLKNKMDCSYARNPFSNKQPKMATNEDVLQGTNFRRTFLSGTDEFISIRVWRDVPHGSGSLKTSCGEPVYSGDWCEGKRHGKGKGVIFSLSTVGQVAAGHGVYSGEWKLNMRHGRGKMMFFSGAVYEGQWKFDKMTGYGTLTLPDGSIQEGTWRDGKLHGCAVLTWPHGVSEYSKYDEIRGQLFSCTREKQTTNSISQMGAIYPQLLSLQGTLSELIKERHFLRKDVTALKKENAEMITKAQIHTFEFRKRYQEETVTSYEKQLNDAEKALKAATEEAAQLKKELEETKAALVCQICFSRPRDCILLPCSHLLYCRVCVSEQRKNGDSRCPTCRGTINSEILCNVNHPL